MHGTTLGGGGTFTNVSEELAASIIGVNEVCVQHIFIMYNNEFVLLKRRCVVVLQ